MTRKEILAMKPGRELDALVAEKVMGQINWFSQGGSSVPVPNFSTDISAAWEVVEKFCRAHVHKNMSNEKYFAEMFPTNCFNTNYLAYGENAPEAICKSALLEKMEEE